MSTTFLNIATKDLAKCNFREALLGLIIQINEIYNGEGDSVSVKAP